METKEIRKRFLVYFQNHGHAVVPSSSLIPDDPSVLFTTAGMQQFKRYYTGELDAKRDFGSLNTVSIQKCFRTSDIDEVGDASHLTFFEMLGNFSFGGYWKEDAIQYAYEFITNPQIGMGLSIDYVTYFDPSEVPAGDWRKNVPKDEESLKIWQKLGVKDIRPSGVDVFWGPTGNEGPCGPTTEIYVKDIEIWNIVFNEFYRDTKNNLSPLKTKGIDTGMGLERLAVVSQDVDNVYETDELKEIFSVLSENIDEKTRRIITDHARGIAFLINDGVVPSNKETGYVLRRLIRRYVFRLYALGSFYETLQKVLNVYGLDKKKILPIFEDELGRFLKTLTAGLGELDKMEKVDISEAFMLFQSYGLPFEVIKDHAKDKAKNLTREDFEKEFAKHQEISRAGAEKKFGGHGLVLNTGELKAGNDEEMRKVVCLHTATHLLHQALREVLGNEIMQRGSDITPERARFDFTFDRKMTPEEIKNVETIVNEKIKEDLPVVFLEIKKEDAEKTGALHFFNGKYPAVVKVYFISPDKTLENAWSKEFCNGPHVEHTGEIKSIKILKEEASSAGIRRIRITLGV